MAQADPVPEGYLDGRVVQGDLVDLEVYGIYKAITELFGEKGWDVVYRSGEIIFEELKKRMDLSDTEPLPLMKKLTRWLVEMGYAKDLTVEQPSEDKLVYELEAAVIRPGVRKLRDENSQAVLAHWSSALLIAGLKSIGVEATMDDTKPDIISPTRSREFWTIRRT